MSLEGFSSTIELHPHRVSHTRLLSQVKISVTAGP